MPMRDNDSDSINYLLFGVLSKLGLRADLSNIRDYSDLFLHVGVFEKDQVNIRPYVDTEFISEFRKLRKNWL